ncbi:hypothetical protein [Sphingobium vermicomposti]|uniref:Uncharacterized protein n=1 Tax=Sphingobium vermicomposti TaxID=529005 RepID=A0A846M2W1_9SPHN|nr:hypothetical protein [Sphingobium vermicomposti]NIJ16269.1 hypothetical protein [Sphingobium vermicomposti]
MSAVLDVIEPCKVRIPHPMECRPRRPEIGPAWSPGRHQRRDPRDAGKPHVADPPTRYAAKLVAAENLGAVRINFVYAAFMSMTAAHSEKAGRDQYFEGPHETYGFRWDEVNPTRLDLQYQPIQVAWKSIAGREHHITLDWVVETETNDIVFGEDKASEDYFDEPDLNEKLEFAQALLEDFGASFKRRVKGGLRNDIERRVVKDIFDARRTELADGLAVRVRQHIREAGGTLPLGEVLRVINLHDALSLDTARALMFHRVLSMPISAPPMLDTPVTLPLAANKGALRAFLADFVPARGAQA